MCWICGTITKQVILGFWNLWLESILYCCLFTMAKEADIIAAEADRSCRQYAHLLFGYHGICRQTKCLILKKLQMHIKVKSLYNLIRHEDTFNL